MDMICPRCHEPWESDTLHEVAKENRAFGNDAVDGYEKVARMFRSKGCGLAFAGTDYDNSRHCPPADQTPEEADRSMILGELADLMGDDTDGYMSLTEDFGLS